jgi:DNA adenine methylase
MKYMGSKRRIAKHIVPIMLKHSRDGQFFYDCFTGGGNLIENIPTNLKRVGIDINIFAIEALKFIQTNVDLLPKNKTQFNEINYNNAKNDYKNGNHEFKYELGYVGFALSYGGKFFGGWRRDKEEKRDYVLEAYKNARKQSKKIQDVLFFCYDYKKFKYQPNSIIYCDPPYQNTTKYKDDFNYNKFWDWCRKQIEHNQLVFVSEYTAPDDFISIWSKELVSSLDKNTGSKKGIENLFVHKTQLEKLK